MIDYPPIEHVCTVDVPSRDRISLACELHLLNAMIDYLLDSRICDLSDPQCVSIRDYLREARDHIVWQLSNGHISRADDEISESWSAYVEMFSKGIHQNHDKEVRRQCQKEEFAVRDERYYNRYHAFDWEKSDEGR